MDIASQLNIISDSPRSSAFWQGGNYYYCSTPLLTPTAACPAGSIRKTLAAKNTPKLHNSRGVTGYMKAHGYAYPTYTCASYTDPPYFLEHFCDSNIDRCDAGFSCWIFIFEVDWKQALVGK